MSIYKNDDPSCLKEALESIYEKQQRKPDEIVVVIDGPIPTELEDVLYGFAQDKGDVVRICPLKENRGLGEALHIGTLQCSGDYILRMDSDDISLPDRFARQIAYVSEHPEVDVLGGSIEEFVESPNEEKRVRFCPERHEDILRMARHRSPMNHVSVCIKKSALLACGGYESKLYVEDYYLWAKMMHLNCIFANLKETLVYVRVGNGFQARRNSSERIPGWRAIQKELIAAKVINHAQGAANMIIIRAFVYAPPRMKATLYNKFLRKKSENKHESEDLERLQKI